jgi:CelD/BcsL family acetyltransferase involved in cellulose biosynthesis
MNVEKITDIHGLVKLRSEWNTLLCVSGQACVFLTNEWFCSWWDSFGQDHSLKVLIFRDSDNALVGIAPLMLTEKGLGFIASREVTDYCDFVVQQGREEEFFKNFLGYVRADMSGVDRLCLEYIREESSSVSFLSRLAAEQNLPYKILEAEVALCLDLPETYDNYISELSRKNRHELRRKVKRTETISGLETISATEPDEIQSFLESFIDMHKKSSPSKYKFWQKKGMADFFRKIVFRFSQKNWVELNLLFIQKELAAALLNFDYKNDVYLYNVAFNPRYGPYSPGIYLFNQSIKRAVEQKKRRIDFLRGREKYKYYFGAKECKIKDFILSLRVQKT